MEDSTETKMGRPTKYTDKLIEKGWNYVENWRKKDCFIPSKFGLARHLKISLASVKEWKKDPKKPDFLAIVEEVELIQAETLINKGLNNDFNSSICKLILTKHGFSDKQELTGKDGEPFERNWTVTVVSPGEVPIVLTPQHASEDEASD